MNDEREKRKEFMEKMKQELVKSLEDVQEGIKMKDDFEAKL